MSGIFPETAQASVRTRRLCAAPMMDRTDRHLQRLLRLISSRIRLFTEMIPTGALLHASDPRKYASTEPGTALQIGGSRPEDAGECAWLAEQLGFDEINLNAGCPSGRVRAGAFGACLMRDPLRVAECVSAMRERTDIAVTVKCRLGVDDQDLERSLDRFVEVVSGAGCQTFYVHARKALLQGLSPKQNRTVPPLQYSRVWRLKQDFPQTEIIINGGIRGRQEALRQIARVDGIMIGRPLYEDPWSVRAMEQALFEQTPGETLGAGQGQVLDAYLAYARAQLEQGEPVARLVRHLSGIFRGRAGAREWRCAIADADSSDLASLQDLGHRISGESTNRSTSRELISDPGTDISQFQAA